MLPVQPTPHSDAARPVLPALPEGSAEPVPGEMSFPEFLAALNPLHHLPVVGTIYRAATGETIQPAMRILGGALLGGPVGMLSSLVLATLDELRSAPDAAPTRVAAPTRRMDGTG
jgi:hypothetical protein